jgi:nuclear RNA export factor
MTINFLSAIRKFFPKIKKLDGDDLPVAIGFDVEETVKAEVPPTRGNFIPESVQEFANNFLKAYYDLYDSDDRQQLIAAYHDSAAFSYSIIARSGENSKSQFPNDLLQESRNLSRVNSTGRRVKLLHQGKINIIAALNSLPVTSHVKDAFQIDVPFFSSALVLIVVNGLVVETWKKVRQLRTFTRSFSIVPHGTGFVIINDMLLWTNSSFEQRKIFSAIVKTMNVSSDTSSEAGTSTANRDLLVQRLQQETKMNETFSRQCLEESNYDYSTAVTMFTQLNTSGMIPPDAFS